MSTAIDAVYVLKDDTGERNWELRYSLRSLERYISGIRNVVIVTNTLPPFINPEAVTHIQETDRENTKDQSIFRKVLTACESDLVSDPFLFLNDDHFLLQKAEASSIPNYVKRDHRLRDSKGTDAYSSRLRRTSKELRLKGFSDRHFDVHFPIIYEKEKFIRMSESFRWRIAAGFVVKSLYGNFHNLEGVEATDCKLSGDLPESDIRRRINGRFVFSTKDKANTPAMLAVLEDLCGAEPSRWERQPTSVAT